MNAEADDVWAGRLEHGGAGLEILGRSADCIKVLSPDGELLAINRPGLELLQVSSPDTLIGKCWSELWPSESLSHIETALKVANRGERARFSAYCPTAQGEDRWWDVSVTRVAPSSAEDRRLVAISRDITETKLLEMRLRVSEHRFRAIADNIAQFAWMADPTGHIFWYNKRWYDYTGTTLVETAGWGWTKLHHPDHVDRVVNKIAKHFESGEPWEDTFPIRGVDGTYRWFLSRAMPIRNEAGQISLWCGTNTDVDDARRWSERLRQKARLIELSHEAIMTWSIGGGIISWNEGCKALYGYTFEQAQGKKTHEILRTRLQGDGEHFENILLRDGAWSGELLHYDKDGNEVWVESRQELLIVDNQQIVLELNRDISERRRNDELKRLLLAELDHRVKNTLAIVQAIAAQTARRALSHKEFTTSFNARLQSLSRAHNLLVSTQWSGAWLRELIADQVAMGDATDDQFSIEGEDVFISAQAALQLALMFFELGTNARKYGALSVRQGRLSIRWTRDLEDNNRINLEWRETGGPPAKHPETFGFGATLIARTGQQANLKAALDFAPAGLICRMSIETSSRHKGPTTYFDIRGDAKRNESAHQRSVEVMIVEDEPLIGMEIEEIVLSAGFVPIGPLATVEQAIARIDDKAPDLVLLDGSLHGKPVDAVVALLQDRQIPFAMVTGFTEQSLPAGIDNRVTPIVSKPVEPEKIVRVMQSLLSRTQDAVERSS
ncbi:MAG: PAS domain S-box protein [Hyphomicrobiaceae bacterium]|nr:PAS domain S-box protein [Hyphomicrobiaceae bacterium]